MNRNLIFLVFLFLANPFSFAQSQPGVKTGTSVNAEDEILQIEKQWLRAAHQADRSALDALMSDDLVATTPAGDIVGKDELMPAEPGSGLPQFNIVNSTVHIFGDAAVVMARLFPANGTGDMDSTTVFQRQNGTWRIVAVQLSRRGRNPHLALLK
jgi:ketosteroid isomerase-like protein